MMKIIHGSVSLILFLCAICVVPDRADAAVGKARLSVHVTTSYGEAPSQDDRNPPQIRLSGNGVSLNLVQDEQANVDYGDYKVTVQWAGFVTSEITAVVNQPVQIIRVAMQIGSIEAPHPWCSILGQVTPVRSDIAIRLLQVFGQTLIDVPVKSDGSFEFRELECGDYMLMALGKDGCLDLHFARLTKREGKDPAKIQMQLPADTRQATCGPSP